MLLAFLCSLSLIMSKFRVHREPETISVILQDTLLASMMISFDFRHLLDYLLHSHKTLFAKLLILVFCHVIALNDISTYLLKAYPGDATKEIYWQLRLLTICTSYISVFVLNVGRSLRLQNAICDVWHWMGTCHFVKTSRKTKDSLPSALLLMFWHLF